MASLKILPLRHTPTFFALPLFCLTLAAFLLLVPSLGISGPQKKVLYVDSYHAEYIWSNDITTGIRSVLDARQDIELRIFRMDSKRHQSEAYKKNMALEAKKYIESWQPDVVIASDDNAAKYLIAPYYTHGTIPFVFCGLNWDASVYGFPSENVTGMLEVALVEETLSALQGYAQGKRIGYLASDTVSERKEYENIVKRFGRTFDVRFAHTFDGLRNAYLELQKNNDMVLIQECRSVKGFNHMEMVHFVRENTTVPTAAMQKYLMHYALFTYAKVGAEQGVYAARTALAILEGKSPKTIPLTENKQVEPYLNMKLAKIMGIKFPIALLQSSHLISAEQKKLFYVNSYHSGYKWSDKIEEGLLKALNITQNDLGIYNDSASEVQLKVFRMDTKLHQSEAFKKSSARTAKTIIDEWHPDIIVISDDNAAKYLVEPYLKDAGIPVVFCGINWDADIYAFPAETITGMVEVTPVQETIELMRPYARGDRLGFLGTKAYSEKKEIQYIQEELHISFADGALVQDFQQWKEAFLRLQENVDMLVFLAPSNVHGWREDHALSFLEQNTHIPTGSFGDNTVQYTLLGRVKIAEEQGWWAGKTALSILQGTPVENISVTTNKNSRLFLNMPLAKKMGIRFPIDLLEQATLLGN